MKTTVVQLFIAIVLASSMIGLVYVVANSARAARVLSIITANAVLAIALTHLFQLSIPLNAFTITIISILGIPGSLGLAVIQSYIL
jgi:hypothetical protein